MQNKLYYPLLSKMKNILLYFLLVFSGQVIAQSELAFDNISPDLLENANAVVLYDDLEFEIRNKTEVVTSRTWAITILNEKGKDAHGTFRTYYDKLSRIKDIECSLHDRNGKLLKKLRRGDIEDIGLGYSSTEVVDNRIKIASFEDERYDYPFTVKFHYIKESKNPMFFPLWYPIRGENTSVVKSTFRVKNPTQLAYRYKETCFEGVKEGKVLMANTGNLWKASNLKAFEREPMSGDDGQIGILLAPVEFKLDGLNGNLSSWEKASSFYYQLNNKRQELPNETIVKVKSLTAGINDPIQKAKIIYEFMQSHTRYMSIQLGVGGWQTIPANKVAIDGYGDCKALTNYTVALLHQVGIPEACAALVNAGKSNRTTYDDFPRMNFNHVIACVPMATDTLWLECTSQTNPFGYIGTFTGNRKALLIKLNGGELVNTKAYNSEQNLQRRQAQIVLAEDGSAEISSKGTYSGIQQERRASVYETLSADEQKKWLLKQVNLPNFELKSFEFKTQKGMLPVMQESMELTSRKLASKSGKRMFLKLNPMSNFFGTPQKMEERTSDIFLNENIYNVQDEDELTFKLPENIEIEYLPKPQNFESDFGTYSASYERKEDILTVKRKVTMQGGKYPASMYQELYNFLKKVNKADKAKAVLILGET